MTVESSKKLLVQLSDICDFTGLSKATIKEMVNKVGFPAQKLNGTWYSTTDAIEDWMYAHCMNAAKVKRSNKR
jgi:predicted DNA-binding transcriptional regulator AlpA